MAIHLNNRITIGPAFMGNSASIMADEWAMGWGSAIEREALAVRRLVSGF